METLPLTKNTPRACNIPTNRPSVNQLSSTSLSTPCGHKPLMTRTPFIPNPAARNLQLLQQHHMPIPRKLDPTGVAQLNTLEQAQHALNAAFCAKLAGAKNAAAELETATKHVLTTLKQIASYETDEPNSHSPTTTICPTFIPQLILTRLTPTIQPVSVPVSLPTRPAVLQFILQRQRAEH